MNWWPRRRTLRAAHPPDETCERLRQAQRQLRDAERRLVGASEIADQLAQTRDRDHFKEAVARAIRGT